MKSRQHRVFLKEAQLFGFQENPKLQSVVGQA